MAYFNQYSYPSPYDQHPSSRSSRRGKRNSYDGVRQTSEQVAESVKHMLSYQISPYHDDFEMVRAEDGPDAALDFLKKKMDLLTQALALAETSASHLPERDNASRVYTMDAPVPTTIPLPIGRDDASQVYPTTIPLPIGNHDKYRYHPSRTNPPGIPAPVLKTAPYDLEAWARNDGCIAAQAYHGVDAVRELYEPTLSEVPLPEGRSLNIDYSMNAPQHHGSAPSMATPLDETTCAPTPAISRQISDELDAQAVTSPPVPAPQANLENTTDALIRRIKKKASKDRTSPESDKGIEPDLVDYVNVNWDEPECERVVTAWAGNVASEDIRGPIRNVTGPLSARREGESIDFWNFAVSADGLQVVVDEDENSSPTTWDGLE